MKVVATLCLLLVGLYAPAQTGNLADAYVKAERMITMRDGVKLFTAIYTPKDTSQQYPLLIIRTPYSCAPYGAGNFPRRLGPNPLFAAEKYIFVVQDVRGRYMSEGQFEEMTPAVTNPSAHQTDESTDCYDTIDWLLKNTAHNNGRAGIYGISYPGFYATAALPNAHPALKAVSPQAPVTDEFEGDDAYHRGAFFLMDNFGFLNSFDHPRAAPWTRYPSIFDERTNNAYDFFLKLGPLKNANLLYYKNKSSIWNEYLQHDTKDDYWKKRDIRQHLTGVQPAVLVVGGWYDAEDLFGALETYRAIEQKNKKNDNRLVMGPWTHGAWARPEWSSFAGLQFGSNTSLYFQQLEFDFFNYYLKGKGSFNAAEATIFETGTNQWKQYNAWPPKQATTASWYFGPNGTLTPQKPTTPAGHDAYVSDPANPVPYIGVMGGNRNNEYMAADQTFASTRNDVLTYQGQVLENNLTLSGPLTANLYISTTSTDVDLVVKLMDVEPATGNAAPVQRLVRAEVIRGKFRNSFEKPEAFVPGKVTPVNLQLNDVAHTFLKGHRLMVQVQSSWFPLVDRNPQKFMSIAQAEASDFQPATVQLYHGSTYPSGITFYQLK